MARLIGSLHHAGATCKIHRCMMSISNCAMLLRHNSNCAMLLRHNSSKADKCYSMQEAVAKAQQGTSTNSCSPVARMRLILGSFIKAVARTRLGLSIHWIRPGGAPARSAASRTMRAAAMLHLAARTWGDRTMAFLQSSQTQETMRVTHSTAQGFELPLTFVAAALIPDHP
jgi:hypothetical protein